MQMIIFLFMNSIVTFSSFLITYKLLKNYDSIDSLICWFVIYLSQIVFSELLLGIFGALYLYNIILVNLIILLIVWLFTKDKLSSLDFSELKNAASQLFKNKIAVFLISVILGFGLVKVAINLINPPFGWDSLNYHFTFPVEWIKQGNLDMPITIFDDPSPSYYPINGSLFYLWFMLPLKNVFLADLGQLPFFILTFLCVYNISRKLALNNEMAFYAVSLFLLIPNFFKQLQIAYADVMVAGLFLASLNYLFLLKRSFFWQNVLIYSLSTGLLLGTKTVALPYSILLLLPFIYIWIKNWKKPYLILIFIFAFFILGSFSYLRNALETGNPLYPLDLKLFGKTIFKGVMDINITYRAHFTSKDYRIDKILFHEGLGLQTLIFIFPALFLSLPITIIKKRKVLNFNLVYFLILPVLICLVYRYLIPLANVRYLYPLLGIGVIMGFFSAGTLNINRRIVNALVVISALASMPELAKRQELVFSIILTSLFLFLLPSLIKYVKQIRLKTTPSFIVLFLVFTAALLIIIEKDYTENEYPRYIKMIKYSGFWPDATRAWDWLNGNTSGNNIAYAGRPVPFPLYGENFKNSVYYVSVNKIDPVKLHYFSNGYYDWRYGFLGLHKNLEAKGNYRSCADYSIWLNNLLRRNTDLLFIYSLHQTGEIEFPFEDKWAEDNPNKFMPVFRNETIHIYKISEATTYGTK